jgi:hypothetical protein
MEAILKPTGLSPLLVVVYNAWTFAAFSIVFWSNIIPCPGIAMPTAARAFV